MQVMTWEELQQPPASVCWKHSAATTFWGLEHLLALLTVTHTPHKSSWSAARAPHRLGRGTHPACLSEQAAGNGGSRAQWENLCP